jgi:hypothetical protein
VGLTVFEPLAAVEVMVPGAMAMEVAPVVAQVSVLLEPELMLVGFAAKEVIVGAEPVPEDELGIVEPQPARAMHARGSRSRFNPLQRNLFNPNFSLWEKETAFMRPRFEAVGNAILARVPTVSLRRAYCKKLGWQHRIFR